MNAANSPMDDPERRQELQSAHAEVLEILGVGRE